MRHRYDWRMPKLKRGDNYERLYDHDPKKDFKHDWYGTGGTFEEFLTNAVRKAHQEWVDDPISIDKDWNPLFNNDGTPVLEETIWDRLELPDSKFCKRHHYYWRIRVPKLNRSDREWLNFYVTFPFLAEDVIKGEERYCSGAKLKWIPLFTKILEKEWPKETQYKLTSEQLQKGIDQAKWFKKEHDAFENIGKKVEKYSGKPFRSQLCVNTIKSVDYMEVTSKGKTIKEICYTFEEDDSMVSVDKCKIVEDGK